MRKILIQLGEDKDATIGKTMLAFCQLFIPEKHLPQGGRILLKALSQRGGRMYLKHRRSVYSKLFVLGGARLLVEYETSMRSLPMYSILQASFGPRLLAKRRRSKGKRKRLRDASSASTKSTIRHLSRTSNLKHTTTFRNHANYSPIHLTSDSHTKLHRTSFALNISPTKQLSTLD